MKSIELLPVSAHLFHPQRGFRTRRTFILTVYCILLSAFAGRRIECKKKLRGNEVWEMPDTVRFRIFRLHLGYLKTKK